MACAYSVREVLELAAHMEENTAGFFRSAAHRLADPAVREVLEGLASEGDRHTALFHELAAGLSAEPDPGIYTDDFHAYMAGLTQTCGALSAAHVRRLAEDIRTPLQAVDAGVAMQKDALLVYESLKGCLAVGQRRILEDLIAGEKRHFRQLLDLRTCLQKGGPTCPEK